MNYHGHRFLSVAQFVSHARSLKVRSLSLRELEFYERHRLLLPKAQTLMPAPHALAVAQERYGVPVSRPGDLVPPDEWERLHEYPAGGIHPFDREQGGSPFFTKPDGTTFEPWDTHRIPVTLHDGTVVAEPVVERYYSYWQVHIVELLRTARYYKLDVLVRELPESSPVRAFYRIPEDTEWALSFQGKAPGYEVLTLFDLVCAIVLQDLDAPSDTPPKITPAARRHLRERAQEALAEHGLDEERFFGFVANLLGLRQSYLEFERSLLADDVERDLALAQRFARYAFGYDWDEFTTAASRHNGAHVATMLRRLDPLEAAADKATENLQHIVQELPIELSDDEARTLPEGIVQFCFEQELDEVLSALAGYSFTESDVSHDRFPGFLHRRLRPLALAVEQLLHGILDSAGESQRGLSPAIQRLGRGSDWIDDFNYRQCQRETSDRDRSLDMRAMRVAESARDDDPESVTIARTLILAVAARNLVSHRKRFLDGGTARSLGGACADSIALVWLLSSRHGLMKRHGSASA